MVPGDQEYLESDFCLINIRFKLSSISSFLFCIDVRGYKRWAFWLKVIGMNSIAVYLGVRFLGFTEIANKFVFGLEQFVGAYYPVIRSLTALILVYIILYWMYKKGTFLKI